MTLQLVKIYEICKHNSLNNSFSKYFILEYTCSAISWEIDESGKVWKLLEGPTQWVSPWDFRRLLRGRNYVTIGIQPITKLKLVVSTPLQDFQVERKKMRIHKSYAFSFFKLVPLPYNFICKMFFSQATFLRKNFKLVTVTISVTFGRKKFEFNQFPFFRFSVGKEKDLK